MTGAASRRRAHKRLKIANRHKRRAPVKDLTAKEAKPKGKKR